MPETLPISDTITIKDHNLVLIIGPSGSGKSTWCQRNFGKYEVVSSDECRALVSDDELDQPATKAAFDILFHIAAERMKRGRHVVIDSTALRRKDRAKVIQLARDHNYGVHAILFDVPEEECLKNNKRRPSPRPDDVVVHQCALMRQALPDLKQNVEGFDAVDVAAYWDETIQAVRYRKAVWASEVARVSLPAGPYDIIGDVHGCYTELVTLLTELGYQWTRDKGFVHPEGRTAVFVGDLTDRGPMSVAVLETVITMVDHGNALWVEGNHDNKLIRWLKGNPVKPSHGLEKTIDEFASLPQERQQYLRHMLLDLYAEGRIYPYLILDDGKLVVAHAGIKEDMIGKYTKEVREFVLYGDVDRQALKEGTLIRRDWTETYKGDALVVYGHTVVSEVRRNNNTVNIDTGCAFGNALTAYRYPEHTTVSVAAYAVYDPSKFEDGTLSA